MADWRGINYSWWYPEKEESALVLDNGRWQGVALVNWAAWPDAVLAFAGKNELVEVAGLRYVSRTTPMPHPDARLAWLYCVGCSRVTGAGAGPTADNGLAGYNKARMTLTFSSLTFNVLEDADVTAEAGPLLGLPDEGDACRRGVRRYITRLGRNGGKTWTIPQGVLWWPGPNPQPLLQGSFGKRIPYRDIEYVWHLVPEAAVPRVSQLLGEGCVNDAEFDGFPAETLLAGSWKETPRRGVDGARLYDLSCTFRLLPNVDAGGVARGHNYLLRAIPGTNVLDYQRVATRAGDPPYRSFDFARFFRPDQP